MGRNRFAASYEHSIDGEIKKSQEKNIKVKVKAGLLMEQLEQK